MSPLKPPANVCAEVCRRVKEKLHFHHSGCSLQSCVHTTAVASTSFLVLRLLPERHGNGSQHVKKSTNSRCGFRRFSHIHPTALTSSEFHPDLDLETNDDVTDQQPSSYQSEGQIAQITYARLQPAHLHKVAGFVIFSQLL